jgi:hypothetical protein
MAYAPLPSKSAGDTVTLANYDVIKANFEAGVPDLFTTKGDLAVASAADTAVRLARGGDGTRLEVIVGEEAPTPTNIVWRIQPCAVVTHDAGASPSTSTWTTLDFNTQRQIRNSMHSASVNNSRLTVPTNGDGLYHIGGCVEFGHTTGAGALFGVRILLNGATVLAQVMQMMAPTANIALSVSRDYQLAATNYVELQVFVSESVSTVKAANYSPEFWAHWVRR